MVAAGSEYRAVAGCCENCKGCSGFITDVDILDLMRDCKLLRASNSPLSCCILSHIVYVLLISYSSI